MESLNAAHGRKPRVAGASSPASLSWCSACCQQSGLCGFAGISSRSGGEMPCGDPWTCVRGGRFGCPVHGDPHPPEIPLVEPFTLVETIAVGEDNSDLTREERQQIASLLAQNRALKAEVNALKLVAKRRGEHIARLQKADRAARVNKECVEMRIKHQKSYQKSYEGALREALVELCIK